ncbi:MAG TPA: RsmD family RNA methyltransferase, partial [Sedimentisphaerales bacterium]|nr:RsmD family RNA methyltransferase [Sedimentisphaerales bacterium]
VRANAFTVGTALGMAKEKCELVFVDPPYATTCNADSDSPLAGLLEVLGEQVTDDGMVIVRTSRDVSLLDQYGQFRVAERRQWGTMAVTILAKAESDIPHTISSTRENDKQAGGNKDH